MPEALLPLLSLALVASLLYRILRMFLRRGKPADVARSVLRPDVLEFELRERMRQRISGSDVPDDLRAKLEARVDMLDRMSGSSRKKPPSAHNSGT